MRRPASALTLRRPRTLKAALAILADDPAVTPIAGCTDVFVGLHFGTLDRLHFVDLWGLDELRGIRMSDGHLRIGALATYTELLASSMVRRRVPMLAAAAGEVGGAQVQNRGTLGGNIANGSPAGDTLPVLAAANARIVLRRAGAERTVLFTEFFTGYRTSVRRPDELIVAIEIPRIVGRQWWRKGGTRRAQAISKVMIAGVRGAGDVRVAVGSVAPTVVRATAAEALLAAGASVPDAQAALRAAIAPIDDIRSTGQYRLAVAANLLARFWSETS